MLQRALVLAGRDQHDWPVRVPLLDGARHNRVRGVGGDQVDSPRLNGCVDDRSGRASLQLRLHAGGSDGRVDLLSQVDWADDAYGGHGRNASIRVLVSLIVAARCLLFLLL